MKSNQEKNQSLASVLNGTSSHKAHTFCGGVHNWWKNQVELRHKEK
jgi:hypothetical protein